MAAFAANASYKTRKYNNEFPLEFIITFTMNSTLLNSFHTNEAWLLLPQMLHIKPVNIIMNFHWNSLLHLL